jgi:hypothetical protein
MKAATIRKTHRVQELHTANISPWHFRLLGPFSNEFRMATTNPLIGHLFDSNQFAMVRIAHQIDLTLIPYSILQFANHMESAFFPWHNLTWLKG